MIEKISIENKFKSKSSNLLILGDAISILKEIPDQYFDHCITDPPYNISGFSGKKDIGWLKSGKFWAANKNFQRIDESWDNFSDDEYGAFTNAWLGEIKRVVKPNGNIVIFGTYHNIFKIGNTLQSLDRKVVNSIVWYKRNAFPNITQRMLCESTEYAIWAVNESPKDAKNWIFNYKEMKAINTFKKCAECKSSRNLESKFCSNCGAKDFLIQTKQMRNLWDIPMTPASEKKLGKHPSQKSLVVMKRIIIGCTKPGDLIVDPFLGSGTTALAAAQNKRRFVGIDTSKSYLKLAKGRIEEALTLRYATK